MSPVERSRKAWEWVRSPDGGAILQLATCAVIIAFAVLFWLYSSTTHSALCTFRGDLQRRYDTTSDYLATHRQGVILGIPRSTFTAQLKAQLATLNSLRSLHC